MPIYIVRWADLTLSIVEAANRKKLFELLDEIADPTDVRFKELSNPLFLSLKPSLPVEKSKDNKRTPENAMMEKMRKMMNDETNSDLKVRIGDAKISCHRCILATNEYFSALMNSKMSEMDSINEMKLCGVGVEVFQVVKEYLYLSHFKWTGKEEPQFLFDLLQYCHLIQLKDLLLEVEDKVFHYFQNCSYSNDKLVISEIVHCIKLAEDLQLFELYEKLNKLLFKQVMSNLRQKDEENPSKELLKEIENYNQLLARQYREKIGIIVSMKNFSKLV